MLTRRRLLHSLSAAATATLALPEPRAWAAVGHGPVVHPAAKADAIIVLWMAGGMAAPDTFDPKKYKPFEKGLAVKDVISTFPAIPTTIDGVQICDGLPEIAKVLDRGTLIRSHVQPDLGSILHSRHQYHWHTGYVPPQTVACPHIGAWMSRVLGPRNPVMPAFVNIGQRLEGIGENEEIKAFTTAGFFGSEFGPMNLPFPEQAALAVRPPKGMEPGRFASRYEHFKKLVARSPQREFASDYHQESMLRSLDNAHRLLGATERDAFDITLEPKEVLERYDVGGDAGRFGRGCLLARRLVENGARYVEVTTEYIPFVHWDTHDRGHETMARLHGHIDRPIAALVRDLESRGLLDRTLVVIASEFSRDMITDRGAVRGWREEGLRVRQDRRRAALRRGGKPGHDQRPACHAVQCHGHEPQDGLRHRGPPLLCHRGRQGETRRGHLHLSRQASATTSLPAASSARERPRSPTRMRINPAPSGFRSTSPTVPSPRPQSVR